MKLGKIVCLCSLLAVLMIGCAQQEQHSAALLDGSVAVDLKYSPALGAENSLSFTFFKDGDYEVTYRSLSSLSSRGPVSINYEIREAPKIEIVREVVGFNNRTTIDCPLRIDILEKKKGLSGSINIRTGG